MINHANESDSSSNYNCFESDEATCDGEPVLPMKEGIRHGDLDAVQQALVEGTLDLNAKDEDYTLLHWATDHTDMDTLVEEGLETDNIAARRTIVRELLQRGANVNAVWIPEDYSEESPTTPMDMTEDAQVIQMLREASIRQALAVDDSPPLGDRANHLRVGLISAAALGRTEDCATLCRLGAVVNENTLKTTALGTAAEFGHLETVQKLVRDLGANVDTPLNHDGGQTALYCAVYEGHEDIVEFLLEHEANSLRQMSSFGGMSSWACAGSLDGSTLRGVDLGLRKRIIELVLSASVDMVKEQIREKTEYDERGWRDFSWVFMECVRHGYIPGMDQLIENPRFQFPPSCLQLAVAVGDHDTLIYLLKAGALATHDENGEEERWYGPEFARPSDESIQRCKDILSEWLLENAMMKSWRLNLKA